MNLSIPLDNNPAKIYAYVRDEVEYVPYYGYMKGSLWTMWEGAGNDFIILRDYASTEFFLSQDLIAKTTLYSKCKSR